MRKTTLILALGIVGSMAISCSSKKDYTCECKGASGVNSLNTPILQQTESDAKAACDKINESKIYTSCTLK